MRKPIILAISFISLIALAFIPEGKLKFQITGDKLYLTQGKSDCKAFSKTLDGKPFTKIS